LEEGNKLAYAACIMTPLSAALAHSKIREAEIVYTASAMVRRWKIKSSSRSKAYIPTDEECARLSVADMPVMLRRWMIIQAMTGGRPQTTIDLNRTVSTEKLVLLTSAHQGAPKTKSTGLKSGSGARYLSYSPTGRDRG
jgi:hypothetical protein